MAAPSVIQARQAKALEQMRADIVTLLEAVGRIEAKIDVFEAKTQPAKPMMTAPKAAYKK